MSVCTGVVVFHRSKINWRRGRGLSTVVYLHSSICEGLWSTGVGLGSVCTGICAFFYMGNLVGVVVFLRSIFDWRRGRGLSTVVYVHTSICEI